MTRRCGEYAQDWATGVSSSTSATASCRRRRSSTWSGWSNWCGRHDEIAGTADAAGGGHRRGGRGADDLAHPERRLPVDEGAAHHRDDLVDGGDALSAAAVRLSLRGRGRLGAVGDLQGDGAAAAQGDHEAGDDRDLGGGPVAGLGPATCSASRGSMLKLLLVLIADLGPLVLRELACRNSPRTATSGRSASTGSSTRCRRC